MNFILHFKGWIARAEADERLKTHHVSLYVALFHYWNTNRFRNPFTIFRHEVMGLSKIGSINTYTNGLKELTAWEYIRYEPSFDPQVGSKVHLLRLDKGTRKGRDKGLGKSRDKPPDKGSSKGTGKGGSKGGDKGTSRATDKGRDTYYINIPNNTNSTNNLNERNTYGTSNENSIIDNGRTADTPHTAGDSGTSSRNQKKRADGGRAGGRAIPESVQEAQAYFLEIQSTAAEAEKFCNHFQSNGWKVGGRAAMKDWRAAARKWVSNVKKFAYEPAGQPKPGRLNTGPKNYSEPL
jgi:hypothetical protein